MAWTYSSDPSTSPLDQVRFLVGDTDPNDKQLQDGEITWLLGAGLAPVPAAIRACRALQAKYSRMVTKTVGKTQITASDRAKAYDALAMALARDLPRTPFAGGINRAANHAAWADLSMVPPLFRIGQDEFPGNNSHHWSGYGGDGTVVNPDGSDGYGTTGAFDPGLDSGGGDD